ncbi:MAG: cyclic nucleotide-binding domain-containing protein [Bauldia sp.]|nr:cyclic nucleotide-binding domain-containing protein [Bauldia sp.]
MGLETDIATLSRVPLFQELGEEEKRLLAFSASRLELEANQVLFEKGAPADGAFVIVSGRIDLTDEAGDGSRRILTSCGPGTLLGEMALFTDTLRPARAVALLPTAVLGISRVLMRRMLEEYPDAAASIHEHLADSFVATIAEIEPLADVLDPGEGARLQ